MKDLISVIVPIYKVEKYLENCIDSICGQTYRNLEIILVDDGSPDRCGQICDAYAQVDNRIKVIHKPNGGLSSARNAGLDIATGSYIGFVDSDDWIEPTMYEKLLNNLVHFQADMSFGGVADEVETSAGVVQTKVSHYGDAPFAEGRIDAMKRYFLGSWAAWDKLYRAELFHSIRYPVGEINEDEAIVLQLLEQCERVCYINDVVYHYMKRANHVSITTNTFSEKKLAWQKHCSDNLAFISENYPELKLYAAARYRSSLLWTLTEIALSSDVYSQHVRTLQDSLRKNFRLFSKAPYRFFTDRVRCAFLTVFPFFVYKTLIKFKRGVL